MDYHRQVIKDGQDEEFLRKSEDYWQIITDFVNNEFILLFQKASKWVTCGFISIYSEELIFFIENIQYWFGHRDNSPSQIIRKCMNIMNQKPKWHSLYFDTYEGSGNNMDYLVYINLIERAKIGLDGRKLYIETIKNW